MNSFEETNELYKYTASKENVLLLQKQLEQLSYELDCVGLPTINVKVDVLEQLIESIRNVIKLYRKSISQQKDLSLEKAKTNKEIEVQKREKDTLQERFNVLDFELKLQREMVAKRNQEIDALISKNMQMTKELEQQVSFHKSKANELLHKISRLKLENEDLRVKFKDDIGKYKSKDETFAEIISKYKAKEIIYQETIKKLQGNSHQLLSEVVNLREEIALFFKSGQTV